MLGAQQDAYDRVCKDLANPESICDDTLQLFKTLLDLQPKPVPKKPVPKKPVASRSGTKAAPRRPPATSKSTRKPIKSAGEPKFQIHDELTSGFEPLGIKERKKLATLIFNSALKQLSNAAKTRNTQKKSGSPEPGKTKSLPALQPMEERSNHNVKPGVKHTVDGAGSLLLISKCASVALDYLRALAEENHGKEFVDDGLENGGLIILDKSITLELHSTAEYQSRRLHEQYWKRRKEQRPGQDLYERFWLSREDNVAVHKFATSFQGQLLRLAILKGAPVVRQGFSECFDPNIEGSPVWMLIQGHTAGFLDSETCGNQLRTISLALSKLQTVIDHVPTPALVVEGLQLVSTALQVKCMSWKYLGHQPDFARELWIPLSRAIKRSTEAAGEKSIIRVKAQACLECTQATLSDLGFHSTPPAALRSYCGKGDDAKSMQLQPRVTEQTEDAHQAALILDNSIPILDGWKTDPESAISAAQECTKTLRNNAETLILDESSLIAMTRMRKAATAALDAMTKLSNIGQPPAYHEELQVYLVSLICAMVSFCSQLSFKHTAQSTAGTSRKESGVFLMYAKTIETLIQQESLPATSCGLLEQEFHRSLCECVTLSKSVRSRLSNPDLSKSVGEFLRNVPVRISHSLWKRYLSHTENCGPTAGSIDILRLSIDVLEDLSRDEKRTAMLGLKYERLASAYIEEKALSKAQASLSSSIQFYTEQATFHTAIDSPIDDGCQRDLQASLMTEALGQSLKSYVHLSLDHNLPNRRGTWYYDDSEQHDFIRALILQKQILLALQHCPQIHPSQLSGVIQLWEQLCLGLEFLPHRLSYISKLLEILAKRKDCHVVELLGPLKTLQDLDSYTAVETRGPQYLTLQHILVSVQWSLGASRVDEATLTAHISTLLPIFKQLEKSPTAVSPEVDRNILSASIKALSDLAGTYGLTQSMLDLKEFLLLFQLPRSAKVDETTHADTMLLLDIARLKVELNDTFGAGKTLASVEQAAQISSSTSLELSLVNAEYHLLLGNLAKAKEIMDGSVEHFASVQESTSPKTKLLQELQLCRAALFTSQLTRQMGNLSMATKFARQAVKISCSIWSSFEPKLRSREDLVTSGNESSLQNLTQDMSNLAIVEPTQQNRPILQEGSKYWKLVSLHRSVLRNVADISSHNGLYQDAVYFAQQASKVTAWTGGLILREAVNSELALIYASASEHEKASGLLINHVGENPGDSFESHRTILNYAEALMRMGQSDRAVCHLQIARQKLARSTSIVPMSTKPSAKPLSSVKSARTAAKRSQKPAASAAAKAVTPSPRQDQISPQNKTMHARLNALENNLHQIRDQPSNHKLISRNIATLTPVELVSQAIVFIHDALKRFAMDPSNNTICETALAMPVRYRHVRKSGQMSLLLEQSPQKSRSSTAVVSSGSDILVQAYDCLRSVDIARLPMLSSANVELLHKALSQVMLLSTACKPLHYTPINVVLQSLRPKDVSISREQAVISSERETTTHEQIHRWPIADEAAEKEEDFTGLIQKLPKSWTINSIGLSHDRKELLLSRIVSGSSPFLMRVPLERPGVDEDEPCEFTLEYARQELRDIINKANDSCHDSRGQGDKLARKAWYSERERLDKRLEMLLTNIENIWLGGFRGLLSPTNTDQALLARFGESLTQSLDKHLPSRQKKSKTQSKVELHAHVLELFTSIKFDESNVDFEDSVTDLLYFVVDILQFNGEPNAFDEIDFDALLMDTVDALRGYHTPHTSAVTRHMILVIDKELQSFPWESLPCLRGHPVSRMPSLGAIQERLNHMAADSDTYTIHPTSGAYILNPSSDLVNTQSTFTPLLEQLHPHFHPIINRTPTEAEFEALLSTHPIFLYFGHGAGTQYIRGRTIRSLSQCAVTWLMGCSSAKLTECGLYESYGTPGHYMHAGSPALVGTLWDVTDRDVDRFAVRALGSWGLVDVGGVDDKFWGTGAVKKGGKNGGGGNGKGKGSGSGSGKGKARAVDTTTAVGVGGDEKKVPLDQAVAEARDACHLRYLNGAAPVVYGVPVSLA